MAVCGDGKEHRRHSVCVSSGYGSCIMANVVPCIMVHESQISAGHSLYTGDLLTSLPFTVKFILKPQKEVLWIDPCTYPLRCTNILPCSSLHFTNHSLHRNVGSNNNMITFTIVKLVGWQKWESSSPPLMGILSMASI
jgi:hypothetical protein